MFRNAMLMAGGMMGGALFASSPAEAKEAPKSVFNPDEFQGFQLLSSQYETHDTRRFQFSAGDPKASANLPVASCIVCKFTDKDGNAVVRPYTPTSTNDRKGTFELIIKKYPKSKMGTHVFSMREGEELEMKGPFIKFKYTPNEFEHIGMIAGGTGITPMYQVIRGVLDNPKDKTHVSLVYANNARRDIILNNEIAELSRIHNNFNTYFTLAEVPARWLGGVGYINKEMLETFMPKAGAKNTKVLVCGPPPMMKAVSGEKDFSGKGAPQQGALGGLLAEMGYTSEQVFKF